MLCDGKDSFLPDRRSTKLCTGAVSPSGKAVVSRPMLAGPTEVRGMLASAIIREKQVDEMQSIPDHADGLG
jgi:hypothetical protein